MDNDICAICLDENNEDNFVCNYCNNVFHNTCIKNMNNNYCPLCRKELHNTSYNYKNYIFNNMSNLDDNTENNNKNKYNINFYLEKWNNKKCFINNHKFKLETLGDWDILNNDFYFTYKCMYIECLDCKVSKLLNH